MKRIALTLMVGLSSVFAMSATARAEDKPIVEEAKDAEGDAAAAESDCSRSNPYIGSAWVATGSCLGGSIRYRQRNYAYCDGTFFVWADFFGPTVCSNNPPQEQ